MDPYCRCRRREHTSIATRRVFATTCSLPSSPTTNPYYSTTTYLRIQTPPFTITTPYLGAYATTSCARGGKQMSFVQAAQFEQRFWLQVLGDHARFIRDSLSVDEGKELTTSQYFIQEYDALLHTVNTMVPDPAAHIELSKESLALSRKLRAFKLHLLRRHLTGGIKTYLPPTFINHMLNELDEYLRILHHLCKGEVPETQHPLHHHVLWLQDAMGHAATLQDDVDPAEYQLAKRSYAFRKQFEAYYLKAIELAGYLRTKLRDFPALGRFNVEVGMELKLFQEFLNELEELRLSDQALGVLAPLLPDHMAREELYYLTKLAEVTELAAPVGDPTKPRVNS